MAYSSKIFWSEAFCSREKCTEVNYLIEAKHIVECLSSDESILLRFLVELEVTPVFVQHASMWLIILLCTLYLDPSVKILLQVLHGAM